MPLPSFLWLVLCLASLASHCSAVSWLCICALLLSSSLRRAKPSFTLFSCFYSSSSLVSSCTPFLCGVTSVSLNLCVATRSHLNSCRSCSVVPLCAHAYFVMHVFQCTRIRTLSGLPAVDRQTDRQMDRHQTSGLSSLLWGSVRLAPMIEHCSIDCSLKQE